MSTRIGIIGREELRTKLERGDRFVLVEALAPANYAMGHLPGARNLPPDSIAETAPAILPDKNMEIVVYCGGPTCQSSEKAALDLVALGYSRVVDYAGGKADWTQAGLPLEKDETEPTLSTPPR